ncbi:MAG: T6SS immunity protein Tdi1 domain-containing protein [Terracidiphilus sp.]
MDIHNYLIEQEGKNWTEFVSSWGFLLPESFKIWMVNRFGDMVLVLKDGSVHFFDVGVGTLRPVADNREHFCTLVDLDDNADNWFLITLTDECVAAGILLAPNQCYSFKIPPILGGEFAVQNVAPTDLAVHYSFMADICRQAKDLPKGTRVKIVVDRPPAQSSRGS